MFATRTLEAAPTDAMEQSNRLTPGGAPCLTIGSQDGLVWPQTTLGTHARPKVSSTPQPGHTPDTPNLSHTPLPRRRRDSGEATQWNEMQRSMLVGLELGRVCGGVELGFLGQPLGHFLGSLVGVVSSPFRDFVCPLGAFGVLWVSFWVLRPREDPGARGLGQRCSRGRPQGDIWDPTDRRVYVCVCVCAFTYCMTVRWSFSQFGVV